MACTTCGNVNCFGGCLLLGQQTGQFVIQQQQQANPYFGGVVGSLNPYAGGIIPMDTSLTNFLGIIEDKTDTDACIAFIEQQCQIYSKQLQEIERLRKQFKSDLERAEIDFLSKCLKYRPSISTEMLGRVKGLKAFY